MDYREVVAEIEDYERILASDQAVIDIIREDTYEMRDKYGDERRTEITGGVSEFNMDKLIAQEDMIVTVSHGGYAKRLTVDTYRAQGRGGRGVKGTESKDGDFTEHLFVANTHDYLMFSPIRAACMSGGFTICRSFRAPARGEAWRICFRFRRGKR